MKPAAVTEKKSTWAATESMPTFVPLSKNLAVDVCIVGGGIAGLTSAYLLMKEGKRVCVLEAFELASGQTARTTAHFVTALDDRYFEIERIHGESASRLAAGESADGAIRYRTLPQILRSDANPSS
ncbi:MAG: FAD-binding oxidoreductase [Bdellovibrionota bacterium]